MLGLTLRVASLPDVLQGKVWAAWIPIGAASKRQKDLADIARIVEARPEMRGAVPAELLDRLVLRISNSPRGSRAGAALGIDGGAASWHALSMTSSNTSSDSVKNGVTSRVES